MNAERLLQHFERISEAPDAIPRLRRFILDLAVRGKLVEQDPNDEPASELLKRIQAEKVRLVKEKKIKKEKPLPALDESEAAFAAPANWTWSRLGEIGDWGSGSTPPRGNSEYYGGDITWLKSGELGDSLALKGSEEKVTSLALQKCSFRLNQPGDVLIAMYGATIGKLAILAEPAVTNQAVCGCTPIDGVLNRYLFLYLLSRREDFYAQSEGGAQPNISKIKIVFSSFPLPPLTEQHRIVAKVDELMALCDQLEAAKTERKQSRDRLVEASLHRLNFPTDTPDLPARQADAFRDHARFVFNHLPRLTTRPEHIKQLRQTILNLAVRGKLVPQDPNDEPVIKQQGFFTPSSGIVPFPIPATWCWTTLKSLGRLKGGGTPSKSHPDYWDGEIPWVSPKDMKRDYITTAQLSISQEAIRQSAVSLIEPKSLLFVVRGMILAHSFPVALSKIPLTINQDMKALELAEPSFGEYLLRALKGLKPFILTKVQRSSHGTCRLEGADYSNFPIPLPPLAEQHRIVARVDELMALCDQLEAQLTATEADSRCLLEAVLHEALNPLAERTERP